ncbi:hypothetical protein H5410_022355 [Solanum commersonii]|uniref:Uncharacterized protein n=1 Tax=Solanum commersonii TaxID=4109 RepID=A0A9J5ZEJ5_SOLCO|nr:hypothetical protein H5410_022355 [Solanum commersonii]
MLALSLEARLLIEWDRCSIHSIAAWVSGVQEAATTIDLGGRGAVEELDQHRKRKKGLALLGPYDHLLGNDHTQVHLCPINDSTKASYFRMAEDRLILGWHYRTTDEAKLVPCCYIEVLFQCVLKP